jgi:putative GTP pyrophosphokinase
MTKNMITRSQIKNIGKRLRGAPVDEKLSNNDLVMLEEWRFHHGSSLKYFAGLLRELALAGQIDDSKITITQRLKRIHSIILKLQRFPEMQLSMMDDIAGARIVLPDLDKVLKLTDDLKDRKSKHKIIKLNNYISHPKDDGYRSIHLIYRVEKIPDILIEIQLRTHLQHVWATGVEVFGTLMETSFKNGQGSNDWKEFFKLLSSRFAIEENSPVLKEHEVYSHAQVESLLVKKIKKLNIIEQLNAYTSIFTSNWRDERARGRSGKYALLILNTNENSTKVLIYAESKFHQALKDYSAIEREHHSNVFINAVLVNLDDMENLEKAYPNYFMDTRILSKYLSQIVLRSFNVS